MAMPDETSIDDVVAAGTGEAFHEDSAASPPWAFTERAPVDHGLVHAASNHAGTHDAATNDARDE